MEVCGTPMNTMGCGRNQENSWGICWWLSFSLILAEWLMSGWSPDDWNGWNDLKWKKPVISCRWTLMWWWWWVFGDLSSWISWYLPSAGVCLSEPPLNHIYIHRCSSLILNVFIMCLMEFLNDNIFVGNKGGGATANRPLIILGTCPDVSTSEESHGRLCLVFAFRLWLGRRANSGNISSELTELMNLR